MSIISHARTADGLTSLTTSSPFGTRTTTVLPHPYGTFVAAFDAWQSGALIQNAFPFLSADHRELLMTGITPAEWERMFGKEED